MKTKKFIEEVEELGFNVSQNDLVIQITSENRMALATIGKTFIQVEFHNATFSSEKRLELLEIIMRYLNTPISDREEEKRYRLRKIPIPLLREVSDRFYRKPLLPNYGPCTSIDITESFQYQVIFTETEIAKMDISGFEKVEVEE